MDNSERRAEHQKPQRLEELLRYFNALLDPLEDQEVARVTYDGLYLFSRRVHFGSTLLFQYLAATGLFTYPTNFVSRFYYAPYIGARLQEMLFDADQAGEISLKTPPDFESTLGGRHADRWRLTSFGISGAASLDLVRAKS